MYTYEFFHCLLRLSSFRALSRQVFVRLCAHFGGFETALRLVRADGVLVDGAFGVAEARANSVGEDRGVELAALEGVLLLNILAIIFYSAVVTLKRPNITRNNLLRIWGDVSSFNVPV